MSRNDGMLKKQGLDGMKLDTLTLNDPMMRLKEIDKGNSNGYSRCQKL